MDNEEYLNKKEEGYKAFGSYDFYKKTVLENMFECMKWMDRYEHLYFQDWYEEYNKDKVEHKDKITFQLPDIEKDTLFVSKTFNAELAPMMSYIRFLKRQVLTLYPKISKLEEKSKLKYYAVFDPFLDEHPRYIILKYARNMKVYRTYIELIEELGYSDMNMKQDINMGGDY